MEKTTVRQNMMKDEKYRPYCGNDKCSGRWPRMRKLENYNFKCPSCGFETKFEDDFFKRYVEKWHSDTTAQQHITKS